MNKNFALKAIVAGLIGCAAISAHAGFVNEGGAGEIRVIGKLSTEDKAIGLGRNVPIREAVRQVIPADFAIRFANGAESQMDKRTTWRGGRPWTDVLTAIVETVPELSAEIDVATKVVTFIGTDVARSGSGAGAAPTAVWKLHAGAKVSETFASWAREAGWSGVFWEAPELISDIDAPFPGSFEEAITKTVEAISRPGSQLRVIFYGGNKVVRIVEVK